MKSKIAAICQKILKFLEPVLSVESDHKWKEACRLVEAGLKVDCPPEIRLKLEEIERRGR